jgi:DNA adenine methylase
VIKSPIKWAGGKTRVMPQLLKHLPKADCLIEPFVGSGTVFMNTEYRRYVLCDSNRALINFFLALRDDTERLIAIAKNQFRNGNNADSYYEERKLFNHLSWDDECTDEYVVRWAASFLYLNRHCFNGLYRTNQMVVLMCHLAAISNPISLKLKCAYSPKRRGIQSALSLQ